MRSEDAVDLLTIFALCIVRIRRADEVPIIDQLYNRGFPYVRRSFGATMIFPLLI